MMADQKNYQVTEIGTFASFDEKGRMELGDTLGLTGCEISVNSMPAGKSSPFFHKHKLNEEIYVVISGSGVFYLDQDEVMLQEGSVVCVAPAADRALKAGNEGLKYLCIQAQQNSLTQKTMDDGVLTDTKIK